MAKTKTKTEEKNTKEKKTNYVVGTRGRMFEGFIIKKFPKRVVINVETTAYIHKFERFFKKKSKIHARLPEGMDVSVGDYVKVQECRPLSKIIHAIVVAKVHSAEAKK